MVGRGELAVRVHPSLADIPSAAWDACAGSENPFVSYAFLAALEECGAVGQSSGWQPRHLTIADSAGGLAAAMPMYAKSHSQGEYVFDHGWAQAFERAGGRYYPKLQAAVPFTPVPGPRLLVKPGEDVPRLKRALGQAAAQLASEHDWSSVHITFCPEDDAAALTDDGYLTRTGEQYHWFNRGYGTFDDFLGALSSRKRKTIRRERRDAQTSGIEILRLTGGDIERQHWDAFFAFYMDTGSRKWGRPYLNRAFFTLLGERLGERCLLVLARRQGSWIAGALNLIGADALYGRNWGCLEFHPFLHFELCYYQAIEHAIATGLARVEAGAQGEHKLMRGYEPVATYSAHWIAHGGFRRAVAEFLTAERTAVAQDIAMAAQLLPFKHRPEDEERE